jgi:uncharacterized coiled-coil DUF342 family protein
LQSVYEGLAFPAPLAQEKDVTDKERREIQGTKQELMTTIGKYVTEYQQRRSKIIKLRSKQRQMEKLKNSEHAEAYFQTLQTELPIASVLLNEIATMQEMLRDLNELAA